MMTGAMMQPLNWDTAARTPFSESFSLFVTPEPLRQPSSESFGDHLYRSSLGSLPGTANARESEAPLADTDSFPVVSARARFEEST
jgi:hypothetical protein